MKTIKRNGKTLRIAGILGKGPARPDPDFVWITQKGESLYVSEMATPHLFFAVRMLWNHTVPPAFRVGEFKRWPDVFNWTLEYKNDAASALLYELGSRDDVEDEQLQELGDMAENAEVLAPLLALRSIGL